MKNAIIVIVVIIIVVLAFMFFGGSALNTENDTRPVDGVEAPTYVLNGTLQDVTGGETVRGITTLPDTTGTVRTGFIGENFVMEAEFSNLPEPQGDDFYEGWLVRKGDDFSVISTGVLVGEDSGTYSNGFTSEENLLDHTTYILTIEPNDGDPAPADHILEGDLR